MADRVASPPALSAAAAAFFVSGVSALVYQIAWQRILSLPSGVGIYSIAMIVAAFWPDSAWAAIWAASSAPA